MSNSLKTTNSVGFVGVITEMASLNRAVETNAPRQTANGLLYSTDLKMKWLIRDYWANAQGEKSVFVKSSKYLTEDNKIAVRTLEQRIKHLFDLSSVSNLATKDLIDYALTKQDIKNFGITAAISGSNASVTAVSNIQYAKNIFKDTEVISHQINGAYATKDGNQQATLGRKNIVDFANYVYNFSVKPSNLSENTLGIDVEKYTESDYNWLKKGLLKSVHQNQSASTGSYTGYGLFVDLKEDEDLIQFNFDDYVTCTRSETESTRYVVDVTRLADYLAKQSDVIEHMTFYKLDNVKLEFVGMDSLEQIGVEIKDMSESRFIEL